jgi:hypothetical protein
MQMSMDRAGQGVRPAVSVIVPTRNERQNVLELHRRVTAALRSAPVSDLAGDRPVRRQETHAGA